MSVRMNAATLVDAVATADAGLDRPIGAGEAIARDPAEAVAGDRYLLLSIGSAQYAVLEAFITEIDYVPRVTPVPHVPAWVRGVTSLRGDIVSVVDMRAFVGVEARTSRTARIVVVRLLTEEFATGLLVDGVGRIVEINPGAIAGPEAPLDGRLAPYVNGTCAIGERVVAVLDLDRLLRSTDIRQFEERKEDPAELEGQGTSSCEEH